jgi:Zn-dependent peptidase ImmA (M78 family)
MNKHPSNVVADLRDLMPARPLADHEARGIAERQAIRFLKIFEFREPSVDIGVICELPRIRVRVEAGLRDSGLSYWDRGKWVIGVNGTDSHTRRRFTLGHEFKHILDHPFIETIYADRRGKPDEDRAEAMCDYFAACLLMPRLWVKRLWAQGVQDTAQLATRFYVSPKALNRRLEELGLIDPWSRRHPVERDNGDGVRQYFRTAPVNYRDALAAA